jgi:hypothetical protein
MPGAWVCQQCDELGACEICESCSDHCVAKPNDLEAHRSAFDVIVASVDAKRELH